MTAAEMEMIVQMVLQTNLLGNLLVTSTSLYLCLSLHVATEVCGMFATQS